MSQLIARLDQCLVCFLTSILITHRVLCGLCCSLPVFCSLICPFISLCVWWTSVRLLCVYTCIYLCWFEGCKHIWYWFWGVRYDSNWLNPSAVRNITCHHRTAPSSSARHMYYRFTGVMTTLAFVLVLLFFFSPLCVTSFPSIPCIELFYWDWSIDHCSR